MIITKRPISRNNGLYIFREPVDMRRQINGLVAIVEGTFDLDPFSKALFIFCNRKRDKLKAVRWCGDGFELYYRRLEKGRFQYPFDFESDDGSLVISEEDFNRLCSGLVMERFVPHKRYAVM